jgi:hypothetical protein
VSETFSSAVLVLSDPDVNHILSSTEELVDLLLSSIETEVSNKERGGISMDPTGRFVLLLCLIEGETH